MEVMKSIRSCFVHWGIRLMCNPSCMMSNTIERLSGGLVLSGWAGITVTRILLTDRCYLATGGSIFDAKYICYDIVVDMVRYESFDICALLNAVIGTP